jgi:hypothetical protein
MGSFFRQRNRDGSPGRIWWVKYCVNGRPVRESTRTAKDKEAERFLKQREGAVATGAPIPPRLDRILFDELATDLRTFYQTTGRRRLDEVEDRGRRASGRPSSRPMWPNARA